MCRALSNLGDHSCEDALPELEKETFVSLHERLEAEKVAEQKAEVAVEKGADQRSQ